LEVVADVGREGEQVDDERRRAGGEERGSVPARPTSAAFVTARV